MSDSSFSSDSDSSLMSSIHESSDSEISENSEKKETKNLPPPPSKQPPPPPKTEIPKDTSNQSPPPLPHSTPNNLPPPLPNLGNISPPPLPNISNIKNDISEFNLEEKPNSIQIDLSSPLDLEPLTNISEINKNEKSDDSEFDDISDNKMKIVNLNSNVPLSMLSTPVLSKEIQQINQQKFYEISHVFINDYITPELNPNLPKEPEIIIDEKDIWEKDNIIDTWLQAESKIELYSWGEKLIKSLEKTDNKLKTGLSTDYYNTDGYRDNEIVKLYAQDCVTMKVSSVSEKPIDFSPDRVIVYQSELPSFSENPEPNKDIHYSMIHSYISNVTNSIEPLQISIPDKIEAPISKYIKLTLKEFDISGGFFEPIICNAFLFKGGRFCSERWNFIPTGSKKFFDNAGVQIDENLSSAFELVVDQSKPPKDIVDNRTYLVILLKRALMVDNGKLINEYYLNPNERTKSKAEFCLEQSWPRTKEIFCPFAFTLIPLQELMNLKSTNLPNPYFSDQPLNSELLTTLIEKPKKRSPKTLPFKIKLECSETNLTDPRFLLLNGLSVINSFLTPLPLQGLTFRHQFLFAPKAAAFRLPKNIKGRNIFAKISMRPSPDEDPLPLLYSPIDGKKTQYITTTSWYHQENPSFSEIYITDLPYPLPKDLCFVVEFYHGIAQKHDLSHTPVGKSIINVLDQKNGSIIDNGQFNASIIYEGFPVEPPSAKNVLQFLILPKSRIISIDPFLNTFLTQMMFFKQSDPSFLTKSSTAQIYHFFLPIVELTINSMFENPYKAILSFINLSKILYPKIQDAFSSKLLSYVYHYVFRDDQSINHKFHSSLLIGWSQYLIEQIEILKQLKHDEEIETPKDTQLLEFFFSLILKSILITNDRYFMTAFSKFIKSWVEYLYLLPIKISNYRSIQLAKFMNMLFDLKVFTASSIVLQHHLNDFENPNEKQIEVLIFFLEHFLHSKLFYISSIHFEEFVDSIIKIITKTFDSKISTKLHQIYVIILRLALNYNPDTNTEIASSFIKVLNYLNPLDSVYYSKSSNNIDYHPVLTFYSYIISYVNQTTFLKWWETSDHIGFFRTIHFLISTIKYSGDFVPETDKNLIRNKEIVYGFHFGLLNLFKIINEFSDLEDINEVINLYFHLLCSNKSIDFFLSLIHVFNSMISKHLLELFNNERPPFPRIIARILLHSKIVPDILPSFFETLVNTEKLHFKNNSRSMSLYCRAIGILTPEQRIGIKFITNNNEIKPYAELINKVSQIEVDLKTQVLLNEIRAEKISNIAYYLMISPDACFDAFTRLAEYFSNNNLSDEELQVYLIQAALILEYSTLLKKIDHIWGNDIIHSASIFEDVCPSVPFILCPNKIMNDLPILPSYCDSPSFNERGLSSLLLKILQFCQQNELFEIGYSLIDIVWPLFEHHRLFGSLKLFFQTERTICSSIKNINQIKNREYGTYFSVTCIGSIFKYENGTPYIYKEAIGTLLPDFSMRILNHYQQILNSQNIQLIQEDYEVNNEQDEEEEKGYIKIKIIEPNFTLRELSTRLTTFEQKHNLSKFSLDNFYIPNKINIENSKQSEKWLHREILGVKKPMPTFLIRQVVLIGDMITKEYQPIRVAYRNFSSLIEEIKSAVDVKDHIVLQNLLQKSLLKVSSYSPTNIGRDFLEKSDHKDKYDIKLRKSMKDFIEVCERGLLTHANWVVNNPKYIPIQNELESSYQSIKDLLILFSK